MDKQYIQDNEIEIKYLRNQLTPEEVEEFEVYLMENPEAIENIELIEMIANTDVSATEAKSSFTDWVASCLRPLPVFAVVSAFLMGNLLPIVWTNSDTPGIAQIAYLADSRNSNSEINIQAAYLFPNSSFNSSSGDRAILRIDVSSLNEGTKFVEISRVEVEGIKKSIQNFQVNYVPKIHNDSLAIILDPSELGEGVFDLYISDSLGDQNSLASKTFRFSLNEIVEEY